MFIFIILLQDELLQLSPYTDLSTGWTSDESWSDYRQEIYLFLIESTPVLGLTLPPILRVPGAFSLGIKRHGLKVTTQPHQMPRLRTSGVMPSLPPPRNGPRRDNFICFETTKRSRVSSYIQEFSKHATRNFISQTTNPRQS